MEKIEASRSEAVEGHIAHNLASSSAMKWHQLEELFHNGEGCSHSSDEDNKLQSVLEVSALIESDGKELQGSAGLGQSRMHIASHVLSPAGDGVGRQAQSSHLLLLSWTNSMSTAERTQSLMYSPSVKGFMWQAMMHKILYPAQVTDLFVVSRADFLVKDMQSAC